MKNYTHAYLGHYYDLDTTSLATDTDACAADPSLQRWYARVDSITPASSDLPPLSCSVLEDVLTTFMYYVSAGHRHVGTIASEVTSHRITSHHIASHCITSHCIT